MLSPRQSRLALVPLLLLALPVVAGLAAIAFQQALAAGLAEALMLAWVLAFVIGIPVLVLLLPIAGRLAMRRPRVDIIPPAGEKIP